MVEAWPGTVFKFGTVSKLVSGSLNETFFAVEFALGGVESVEVAPGNVEPVEVAPGGVEPVEVAPGGVSFALKFSLSLSHPIKGGSMSGSDLIVSGSLLPLP